MQTAALGWGSCAEAAAIQKVSRQTIQRMARAGMFRSRQLNSRLMIWLPDVATPDATPSAPADPTKPKRGRPKNTDRRK